MIYVIIGQSGSGKTSFVKEKFLTQPCMIRKDILPITVSGKYIALGKYEIGIRTEGTDTLSYSAAPKIKQQISRLKGKDIIMEGDRITNAGIMKFLAASGEPVKMFLVCCSLKTSMERLRAAGSTINPAFVKATKTKSKKLFLEFGPRFHGEVINTEGGKPWTN